jgi:hypothetical protein
MTHEEFDNFQDGLLAEVVAMKSTKGREYANSENRFANFNRLALSLDLTNIQVAWVYTAKHLDAIASYCRLGRTQSIEPIRGRIVDAITYLTLITGMIEEMETSKIDVLSMEQDKDKNKLLGNYRCKYCNDYFETKDQVEMHLGCTHE